MFAHDLVRLAFRKWAIQEQIYLGELSAGGTRMNSPPRRLTNDEANDIPTAWTPDSKAVLFYSDRNGTWGIFKQAIGGDTAQPVLTGPRNILGPRLSSDGAWILYGEVPENASIPIPTRLMRVPVSGGAPQFVLEMRNGDCGCARARANLWLIFEDSQDGKQMTITAFDPLKGRGKVLRTRVKHFRPKMSVTRYLSNAFNNLAGFASSAMLDWHFRSDFLKS